MGFIFELLNILLFDDISLINSLNSVKTFSLSENLTKNTGFPLKNLEFLLANVYLIDSNFNYEPLKKILMKIKKKELDFLIEKISNFNKKTNLYELKEEFQNSYDLTLFPENSPFYSQIYERIKGNSMNKGEFSIILGNRPLKFFEKNEIFVKTIEKVMKSQFFQIVLQVFLDEQNEEMLVKEDVLRKALKILHLFIEFNAWNSNKNEYFFNNDKNSLQFPIKNSMNFDIICKRIDEFQRNNEIDYEIALRKIKKLIDETILLKKALENKEILSNKSNENKTDKRKLAILEEFQKKRMDFIEKNQELEENIEKNKESDVFICCFCLQNQTKSNENVNAKSHEILLVICYISKDNSQNYLYSEEFSNEKSRFYLNSCNHLVHKECHQVKFGENYMKNRSNMSKFFDSDIEFMCNYCKNLSNLILPIIEPICNSIELLQLFNEKKWKNFKEDFIDKNYFEDFITKYKIPMKFEGFFEKNYQVYFEDFFNEVVFATSYSEEFEEKSLFFIFDEVLMDLFDKIYYKELSAFISSDLLLVKNLFYLHLYNFFNNCEKNEIEFLKKELLISMKEISNLFTKELNFNIMHQILLRTLLNLRILFNFNEDFLLNMTKFVIKAFMSQIMIICFFIYNPEKNSIILEDFINFFATKEIRSKTMTFIDPFYSLIIGFLISTFKKTDSSINSSMNFLNENDLENCDFFKEFEEILTPEPEILKIFIEKFRKFWESNNEENRCFFKAKLSHISNNIRPLSLCKINNYDEFLVKFMTKKCQKCRFYPKLYNQKLFMCIICDFLLCNGKCEKSSQNYSHNSYFNQNSFKTDTFLKKINEENSSKSGNLTKHAKNFHEGKSVFMNISDGTLLIIKFPLIISLKSLFMNRHGEFLKDSDMNFQNYLKDSKTLGKWVDCIWNKRLPQEVLRQIEINEECFVEGGETNWKNF